jgi:hypothetical protein
LKEERALVAKEKLKKILIINELVKATLLEISRRQKSRALWLKESDKCTIVFHREANSNRRNNSIESFPVNGLRFF